MSVRNLSFFILLAVVGLLMLFRIEPPASFSIDSEVDPEFQQFPYEIGNWKGTDEPVDERTYEILETRNVLSRLYENPEGESIHLLLVGSKKDRRVAHPPEVCYTGSNYNILQSRNEFYEVGGREVPVKFFVAQNERNPKDEQEVVYLYKIGDQFTTNYYAHQLQFALDNLARRESQVLLIRLSAHDHSQFESFLGSLLPELDMNREM